MDILKAYWIPILILIFVAIYLYTSKTLSDKESFRVISGVILGVILGFGANIANDIYSNNKSKAALRTSTINLLTRDAEIFYETIEQQKRMKELYKVEVTPQITKLQYWPILKKDINILSLASENLFEKMFKELQDVESLNNVIQSGMTGNKMSMAFAKQMIQDCVSNTCHKKFLMLFMSEKEIKEVDSRVDRQLKNIRLFKQKGKVKSTEN